MHGAHTLGEGKASAGAGFSAVFASGDAATAVERGRDAQGRPPRELSAQVDAVAAAIAPGVSPWGALRVGLGSHNEAGLTYTGRALRLDARHAFESGSAAVSVGFGVSALFSGQDSDSVAPGSQVHVSPGSFGADVPVLVGWQSSLGIVTLWIGPRGGFERIVGHAGALELEPGHYDLRRWYAGGVAGIRFGFRHLHGVFELDSGYQSVQGSVSDVNVHVTAVTITPAAALVASF